MLHLVQGRQQGVYHGVELVSVRLPGFGLDVNQFVGQSLCAQKSHITFERVKQSLQLSGV